MTKCQSRSKQMFNFADRKSFFFISNGNIARDFWWSSNNFFFFIWLTKKIYIYKVLFSYNTASCRNSFCFEMGWHQRRNPLYEWGTVLWLQVCVLYFILSWYHFCVYGFVLICLYSQLSDRYSQCDWEQCNNILTCVYPVNFHRGDI